MKEESQNEFTPEVWNELARRYLKGYYNLTIKEDHEFWKSMEIYRSNGIKPETAADTALKIFKV